MLDKSDLSLIFTKQDDPYRTSLCSVCSSWLLFLTEMHQYNVNICLHGPGASWLTWKPSDKLFYNRNCYKLLNTTPCALNHQMIPLTAQGYLADTLIWSCFTVLALISIISSSATAFWDGTALGICWWAVRLCLRNKARKVTTNHDQLSQTVIRTICSCTFVTEAESQQLLWNSPSQVMTQNMLH